MKKTISLIIILISNIFSAVPCVWDYDTLKMENQTFPNISELISGNFLRHSNDFYGWRIRDRISAIEEDSGNFLLYIMDP